MLGLGFFGGMTWEKFIYEDWCLDMGGGKNPGNYKYCVVQIPLDGENEGNVNPGKMIPVESNNGIGDGAEDLGLLLEKENKVCDENGKIFKDSEEAKKFGLKDEEFGKTYCPEYKMDDSWDVNKDGVNDCYEEDICSKDLDYMSPRK